LAVLRRSWRYSFRYPGREHITIFLLILGVAFLSNLLIGHFDGLLQWLSKALFGAAGG
jgi:hypothetical protein